MTGASPNRKELRGKGRKELLPGEEEKPEKGKFNITMIATMERSLLHLQVSVLVSGRAIMESGYSEDGNSAMKLLP